MTRHGPLLAALAVGVVLGAALTGSLGGLLSLAVVLMCPLMMILMMRGMHGMHGGHRAQGDEQGTSTGSPVRRR